MTAILLEADEIVVKPFELGRFTDLIQQRLLDRKPVARLAKERVSLILERSVGDILHPGCGVETKRFRHGPRFTAVGAPGQPGSKRPVSIC
jgi:hypothetical protein